ncbi:MAG: ABC transporter ATP-binding protein [Gleimia sp.]|jgi:thiamine transport system ATP-binding protein
MTDSSLVLDGIDVYYGDVHAVKNVSITLESGKILALLGASGSGKSSLLRAIAGLEKSNGRVIFEGEDVADLPVYRRGFGLMFQDGQLFGHRNVGSNVAYGLKGRLPRDQWDARVNELLETVGLPGYASRAVSTLSGGQAQRVALARALAPQPRLLLLDEPLSALDRALREQLSVEVRQIVHRSHTTAIYVTHDQDEAFTVADTVAIMHEGNLAWIGTPQDVWMDPQTVTVARFLGYGPILNPEQASQFGVHVPDGKLLACGPDAWRPAAEGDAEGGVATRIVEGRTVRGAEEVLVEFSDGVTATVSLPIGTDLGTRLNIALDDRKCAVVTA